MRNISFEGHPYYHNVIYKIFIFSIDCSVILTKLDVLDELPEIKIGIAYVKDEKRLDYIPCKHYIQLVYVVYCCKKVEHS